MNPPSPAHTPPRCHVSPFACGAGNSSRPTTALLCGLPACYGVFAGLLFGLTAVSRIRWIVASLSGFGGGGVPGFITLTP